jgi:PAS domain S-box-containing protein
MLDQAHMTSLFENATEGILLTDARGVIILANPAAEKIFGYIEKEMKNNTIEMLLPEGIRKKHTGLRDGFYRHPGNRTMGSGRDLYARNKNGSVFPVEVSLSHYRKENEIFVIAFVVDITQRKEIENNLINKQKELERVTTEIRKLNAELEMKVNARTQILKEALEKLEQSQTELSEALGKERQLNEIKSRFVSMASHEFRTPLSTVLSSASLLSKYSKEEEQEKRDKHIDRIKSSVKHLNDILEDFLSLGKLNEGRIDTKPENINLKEVLTDTVEEMKAALKKEQRFVIDCAGDCMAFTDRKLFRNILINLISNAIKFSGEGKPITIAGKVAGDEAVISVADQGIGISEEDQQHLFSSFFRGANVTNIQGTGLGLHIVKQYVDLLGGKVKLQSKLNKGTTIILSIPVNK